jgi:hypothetical protein
MIARMRGGGATTDMVHGKSRLEAVDLGTRSVYNGSMLFDQVITFLVVRSITNKSKGSNSIDH